MPTPNSNQPIAAEPAAAADVPALPIAVDAATIVAAAINNSANSNISALPDAPSGAAINQTSSETPRPHTNTSSHRETEAVQQGLGVDASEARKTESERKRKEKQKEKEMQQLQQLEVMKSSPFEAIQLTADGKDVLKIGSVVWASVELKYRYAYLKHKNIRFGRTKAKDKLGPLLVQHVKAIPYKNAIATSRRTSNPAATTPASSSVQNRNGTVVRSESTPVFLLQDGSLFRAANVLRYHKECYIATKNPMDRAQLDAGVAHPVE